MTVGTSRYSREIRNNGSEYEYQILQVSYIDFKEKSCIIIYKSALIRSCKIMTSFLLDVLQHNFFLGSVTFTLMISIPYKNEISGFGANFFSE